MPVSCSSLSAASAVTNRASGPAVTAAAPAGLAAPAASAAKVARTISAAPTAMAASNWAISRRTLFGGLSALALASTARAQSAFVTPNLPSPQAPKLDDTVVGDFQRLVIARWGDRVLPNALPFAPYPLTTQEASTQFPYDAVI